MAAIPLPTRHWTHARKANRAQAYIARAAMPRVDSVHGRHCNCSLCERRSR